MVKTMEYIVQDAIRLYGNSHDGTIDSITSTARFTDDLIWFPVTAGISLLFLMLAVIPSPKNFQISLQGRLGGVFLVFIINTIGGGFLTGPLGMYAYVNWNTMWHIFDTFNKYTSFRLFW